MSMFTNFPDFLINVGFGLVPGYTRVAALGNNPDVDIASVPEDIWSGGGAYPWMLSATNLEIVSANVNDISAGTGARTVLINGLDANYVSVAQTVTLQGTSAVALTSPLFRINSALIASAGSNKVNFGDITIRDSGAGTTRAILPAGYGITRQTIYTVPAGFTLEIISQFFAFNQTTAASRFARYAIFIQSPNGFYRLPLEFAVGDEPPYRHDGTPGIILTEKTDFALRCTEVSNNDSNLTAAWLAVQRKNT